MSFLQERDFKHEVYLKGQAIASGFSVSPERSASVTEILRSSKAFVNLIGKHSGSVGDVANISFGVPRYEGRPYGDVAENMARFIMGEDSEIIPLGENQLLVLIESDLEPDEFLERFVGAPIQAYGEGYENLHRGLRIIDGMRREDVLDPIRGKGETFKSIFYGVLKEKIRGFQEDGRISMAWNSWFDEDGDLAALNLDFKEQKLKVIAGHELAEGFIAEGITRKENFFRGESGRHRYAFSVYWDPSVDCCRFSTNAQMGEANFHKTDDFVNSSKQIRFNQFQIFGHEIGVAPFVDSEEDNTCSKCNQKKDSDHKCNQKLLDRQQNE